MAKDNDGPSSSPVIDALNGVYVLLLTAFEQFHRQEHRFHVRFQYEVLRRRYDGLTHCARLWRHKVLNRIERLGGEVDSSLKTVRATSGIKDAYKLTADMLREISAACSVAIAVAMKADDHPTHKILMDVQCKVDHKLAKVEAWLRQVADMKENYFVTLVK